MPDIIVLTLYKFVRLPEPDAGSVRDELERVCGDAGLLGTWIVAPEGINGTVAGSARGVAQMRAWLAADARFTGCEAKESRTRRMPFRRLKVLRKPEIVTFGDPLGDPNSSTGVGTHVDPDAFHAMLEDPDVVVLDCRNRFEIEVGSFPGAIDPGTTSFSEFAKFARESLDPQRHRQVAMFCTGGIRCEKASALLRTLGFEAVFQLRGGVLRYLQSVPAAESRWAGECFVFDQRVSLRHGLRKGTFRECHGCRAPVSAAARITPEYEYGVSCPRCHASLSDARRTNLRERTRQMRLALNRGRPHLGGCPTTQ